MFHSPQDLEASLLAAGLSEEGARRIAALAKPSIKLEATPARDEDIPIGASKIGGAPDLPEGMPWLVRPPYPDAAKRIAAARDVARFVRGSIPFWARLFGKGKETEADRLNIERPGRPAPLSFVAQLDLAALAAVDEIDPDLPREGRLLLFYDVEEQPGSAGPADSVGHTLIHDTSPASALTRRAPPDDIAALALGALAVRIHRTLVPPHAYQKAANDLLTDEQQDILGEWTTEHDALNGHRAGGYPTLIQHEMEDECVLVSRGMALSNDCETLADAASIDLEAERKHWVFLFQIDSDYHNGWMWGDSGMLYVWIHRADLKARRFDKARLILQCY